MFRHFGLLRAVCFVALCSSQCQLVTSKEGPALLDIDIRLLTEGNEDLANLFFSSLELLTPSEAESIKEQSYHVSNVLNIQGQEYFGQTPEQEPKFPFITTTPLPPMTDEERENFKFIFPKGHFMNELLYGPQMTNDK